MTLYITLRTDDGYEAKVNEDSYISDMTELWKSDLLMNNMMNEYEGIPDEEITEDLMEEYRQKYSESFDSIFDIVDVLEKDSAVLTLVNIVDDFDDEICEIPSTYTLLDALDFVEMGSAAEINNNSVFEALVYEFDDIHELARYFPRVAEMTYYAGNEETLAYTYVDEAGGLSELGQDILEQYFDYEAFGRDLADDYLRVSDGFIDTAGY